MQDIIHLIDVTMPPSQPRFHLGCSVAGQKCARKIWYDFRWSSKSNFSGRMLRLFRRGHLEEPTVREDLERAGFSVTRAQEQVELVGHVGGSIDGVVEIEGVSYLLEIKTHNTKSFRELEKAHSVKLVKEEHFAQMQLYMHALNIDQALYYAVCKETDELYLEEVAYDNQWADFYLQRLVDISLTTHAPPKISQSQTWYECKMCSNLGVCHKGEQPQVNCRTCTYSSPKIDGTWNCRKWGKSIPGNVQLKGCDHYTTQADMATDDEGMQEIIRTFDAKVIE